LRRCRFQLPETFGNAKDKYIVLDTLTLESSSSRVLASHAQAAPSHDEAQARLSAHSNFNHDLSLWCEIHSLGLNNVIAPVAMYVVIMGLGLTAKRL
jgi:hypothetical protein